MKAVILCGGRGSRLGSVTDNIPKALVEVRGRPIIWYTILNLYHQGFDEFILPLGYRGDMIATYVNTALRGIDAHIHCIPTGENSSIAKRISQISSLLKGDFLLANGDTLFDFDVEEMYRLHKKNHSLVTLSSVSVVAPWGLIHLSDGKIVGFERERKIRTVSLLDTVPTGIEGRVNAGLTWVNGEVLDIIDLACVGDFETEIAQTAIKLGRASHYEISGMWFPVDTQKDLETINMNEQEN
jgi:glucose-1-phosphate cytidylyltransferase